MNPIPLVDLRAQHRALKSELDAAIAEVLERGDFILGGAVESFERDFAAFVGARHAIGVGTGLDALTLSLRAAGVSAGDEVILPANTFIATAFAVSAIGARPVLVDCEEATLNINPSLVERAITSRTRAIVPVHLYGQPCAITDIVSLAQKRNFAVIEDACQSHGATFRGQAVGTFGLAGCFSFYPAKNLGAAGDGGLIITNDDGLAAKLRAHRHYGQRAKYEHVEKGTNSRLDTLQAAILRVKLKHLARWNEQRVAHARRYAEKLVSLAQIRCPAVAPDRTHVFHLYVIRAARRDALRTYLAERGIETGIHYPAPIHLQPAYTDLGYKQGGFPVAEKAAAEILSLPMFPELTNEQINFVCDNLATFYRR